MVGVGARLGVVWAQDGKHYTADVLHVDAERGRYYVHWLEFNRRLDTWVEEAALDTSSVSYPEPPKKKGKKGKKGKRVGKKDGKKGKKGGGGSDDESDEGEESGKAQAGRRKGRGGEKGKGGTGKSAKEAETKKVHSGSLANEETSHAHLVKNVDEIVLGRWRIEPWYFSPYPPEATKNGTVWLCPYCLTYHSSQFHLRRHRKKCELRHPPGAEIYRHPEGGLSMFEVDGEVDKTYCQNLCLISKLFLDHKTLYFDVGMFLFYVLAKRTEHGYELLGYFSKEKVFPSGIVNNVACILTLPCYQRKGYGAFLISFSYALSQVEGIPGGPERPLSDLGLLGYRSYWSKVLLYILWHTKEERMSIAKLSELTCIMPEDIVTTLQLLNVISPSSRELHVPPSLIEKHLKRKGKLRLPPSIDHDALHWVPYIPTPQRSGR